jgi:hypothetical protein
MDKQTQLDIFDAFTAKQRGVLVGKADDYAGSTDRLNNFKVAGAVCGLSAAQNCLSLIGTKVARLGSLLKDGRAPKNEAIDDSVLDLANYAFLLHCILVETEAAKPGAYQTYDVKANAHEYGGPQPLCEMVQGLGQRVAVDKPVNPGPTEQPVTEPMEAQQGSEIKPGDIVYLAGDPYKMGDSTDSWRAENDHLQPGKPYTVTAAGSLTVTLEGCDYTHRKKYFTKVAPTTPAPAPAEPKTDVFEAGDTVECIDSGQWIKLIEVGKQYTVEGVYPNTLSIRGVNKLFYQERFKIVKKHNA